MSDNHDQIEAILRRYGALGESTPIHRESRLEADLALDSLDRIEIGMVLEDTFKIEISDDDLDSPELGTFGGLCDYIDRRLAPAQAA